MRILTISNFYPPLYMGGYELGCSAVMEQLVARGHAVRVLTSDYRAADAPENERGIVHRQIKTPLLFGGPKGAVPSPTRFLTREAHNQRVFQAICDDFQPDVVYGWNLQHVSIALPFLAQARGIPVAFFVSDPWLSRWEKDAWYEQCHYQPRTPLGHGRKAAVRQAARSRGAAAVGRDLDLSYTQFASEFLRKQALTAGKPVEKGCVIHWGIDVDRYPFRPRKDAPPPLRVLYVGQIADHKGVHTLIEAMNLVVREPAGRNVRVTVAGGDHFFPEYAAATRQLVKTIFLEDNIRFVGMLEPGELIPLYQQHDALVFPSIWDEPFGITPLEAMSSGLAVIATPTGGSPEIFVDEENALLFPPKDARACAAQILRLAADPALRERIGRAGRRTVEARFTFTGMVDQIEEALCEATGLAAPSRNRSPLRHKEPVAARRG